MLLNNKDFILLTQYLIALLNGRSEDVLDGKDRLEDYPDQVLTEQRLAPSEIAGH
jgi:hypothetical protein